MLTMDDKQATLELARRYADAMYAESKERYLMMKLLSDARNLSQSERIRLRTQLINTTTQLIGYDKEGI